VYIHTYTHTNATNPLLELVFGGSISSSVGSRGIDISDQMHTHIQTQSIFCCSSSLAAVSAAALVAAESIYLHKCTHTHTTAKYLLLELVLCGGVSSSAGSSRIKLRLQQCSSSGALINGCHELLHLLLQRLLHFAAYIYTYIYIYIYTHV